MVYGGLVFVPETDVNADEPEPGVNLTPGDPRNYNLKKHMVRLALYELAEADRAEQRIGSADARLRGLDAMAVGRLETAAEPCRYRARWPRTTNR